MAETNIISNEAKHGRVEALQTFIEQTKLLVSLASGFVLAPPAILSFLRRSDGNTASHLPWARFACAEGFLIASILAGFVVLGTIAGSQYNGKFDVYRPASRLFSISQLVLYLAGIAIFLWMMPALV